jgi:hypothetical protein
MKNKQKEWHNATKPLKIRANRKLTADTNISKSTFYIFFWPE